MQGEFAQPDLAELNIEPSSILWNRAQPALGISDVRAIREQSTVSWNDKQSSFVPGSGFLAVVQPDAVRRTNRNAYYVELTESELPGELAPCGSEGIGLRL
jgi:hypothetical protein